ncbi:MAG: NUDIX hydrolase [Muribaculaceae bacterium]|nr:NUDIX hydrolase [Muribaculaceae bacterium]
MSDFYSSNPRFYVSVDCIIFGLNQGRLSILLAKRRFEPEKGKWSLMGGFVRTGESVADAAKRVLLELTGLRDVYMQQVGAFGEVDRDPGERVVSVAYYALINFDDHDRLRVMEHNACWIGLDEMPQLGFDHPAMIEQAFKLMQQKVTHEPVGLNLLPKLFTLTQLQSLYEVVLGEPIDKRNFRKRVAEMAFIEKTDMIDKTSSRRGASLYRFNDKAYSHASKFKI